MLSCQEGRLRNPDVLIIGAGAAGLAAAQRLVARGREVTILEFLNQRDVTFFRVGVVPL